MFSGYLSYTIQIKQYHSLLLPEFSIAASDYPAVDRVEISSTDNWQISVKVLFKQIGSIEEANSIGSVIASQVADRLSFEYKLSADDPIKGDGAFEERDSDGVAHAVIMDHLPFAIAGHDTRSVDASEIPQLQSTLESAPPNRDPYISQFRWIMRQEDPVARFMHMYKILLSLEGGPRHNQGPVDSFIQAEESTVQMVHNPHLNRQETIYTRLRNEVGHEFAGTTPATTRQGMEQHIDKLADHVKTAISKLT